MFSNGACYERRGKCEQFLDNEYGCGSNSFKPENEKSFDFSFFFFYFFKECFFGSDGLCHTQEECKDYIGDFLDVCDISPQGI
jgi:hypothetical protein